MSALYPTSPIKRKRRSKAAMAAIKCGLAEIVGRHEPVTVRQAFYLAVVAGLVEKTEAEYRDTVARLLLELRRESVIPYRSIVDSTRWMRKPRSYTGLEDFIEGHQQAYRRALWAESETHVEMWIEKEALAGVILPVTAEYDVPLMVSRGFASESYLYEAADVITDQLCSRGPAYQAVIYFFGDHDPSGVTIGQAIDAGLHRLCRELLPGMAPEMLVFERVAVTETQIEQYRLPTRPTKINGNSHAAGWGDKPSVELDAIPPGELRSLVRTCIEQHVEPDQLARLRAIEEEERQQLRLFGQQMAEAGR